MSANGSVSGLYNDKNCAKNVISYYNSLTPANLYFSNRLNNEIKLQIQVEIQIQILIHVYIPIPISNTNTNTNSNIDYTPQGRRGEPAGASELPLTQVKSARICQWKPSQDRVHY